MLVINEVKIGIYICHCGTNIAGVIDVEALRDYAEKLPNVVIARNYPYTCSEPGQQLVREDIKDLELNRVIVAACSPSLHETTFRRVLEDEGLNPYLFEMVNIREQNTWVHMKTPDEAFQVAKDLIRMAVSKAKKLEELKPREVKVGNRVLIIGGGIGGLSAALDLANAGFKVNLVEKSPTIGGKMAQLDKTFPTMDCSLCILTPKMVAIKRHPNINLITYAEVKDVQGHIGNFKVKILKKPKYVDETKCTACDECAKVCPLEAPDEFNAGLNKRKVIYIPFAQAVPFSYILDAKNCNGCGKCLPVCEPKALILNDKPKEVTLEVDTIIVATGYEPYNPTIDEEYKYAGVKVKHLGRELDKGGIEMTHSNILTGLEMERLLCASGPTYGKLLRPSDQKKPKKVVYIQCVGSRNKRRNPYCSRVCCMYATKQARQIREKNPDVDVSIFYIDLRAFGKGFEEFYEIAAREYGIQYIRGRVSEIIEDKKTGDLKVRAEDTLLGVPMEIDVDMVVLSVGMLPGEDTKSLQNVVRIPIGADGFFLEAHPKLRPVDTNVDGILICGTAAGPKDIPDTVAQAKAAASGAASLMSAGKYIIEPYFASVNEDVCVGCGTCVVSCPYNAIELGKTSKKAHVSETLCKGCGTCVVACPSSSIKANNFTDEQILSQVEESSVRSD
ncbi:MAG: CoB--CoM heterodisulfide reductase iron-sulfur subunit A family protein [Candidatus Bathyarchaeota archaeon]